MCARISDDSPNEECWQYRPRFNDWIKLSTVPESQNDEGAHAYSHSWGLVIAGLGSDNPYSWGEESGRSVYHTRDGRNFNSIAPMPEISSGGLCLAILDDSRLMAMGLGDNLNHVYLYHKGQDYWEAYPSLAVGRYSMSCGVAKDGEDTLVVSVGGGVGDDTVVEIFSLRERQWRRGEVQDIAYKFMVI